MNNPLLKNFILPPFDKIKYKFIIPAIQIIINNNKLLINKLLNKYENIYNWENFCQPILELDENLNRICSIINHLNYVEHTDELRKIYNIFINIINEYNLWIKQNKKLYDAYIFIKNNKFYLYNYMKKKSINNIIHYYESSGILLNEKDKKKYVKIIKNLSYLSIIFNNNMFDSITSWELNIFNKIELKDIPNNILNLIKDNAKKKNKKGYLISLDIPIYLGIMQFCKNKILRKTLYYAYNTRASNKDKKNCWDNFPIIIKELKLRYRLANLLKYNSYTEKSLMDKSVKNFNEIIFFLNNLVKNSYNQAQKEVSDLKNFIKKKYNLIKIKPWDTLFYVEKYKYHLYGINDNIIRSYFPLSYVIYGMFKVINKIFGLIFEKRKVNVWNKNILFFDVFNENHELYGSIYFDLYIRKNKRNGAWMDICQSRLMKSNNRLQYPVAYINCNFSAPINNISLLTHNDVITLFHEFGHALHHIITKINIPNISGINGIYFDIVEFPSQFIESLCWEPKVITLISNHYQNNEIMPPNIVNNLVKSKKYNSALSMMRQIELSLFDIRIHNEFNPVKDNNQILELMNEIRSNLISIVQTPSWNKYINIFNHIFAGEYAAGYYSYLWSEQFAADSFLYFKENNLFNKKIGKNFLDNFLSQINIEDPFILFEKFRNRKLDSNILLIHKGIKILKK
ncbi:M3 family metallopeptidase [Enterobacteriaceae endosymbiont of Plateumaris braccata]|uniref:M3 family metallopeptidase n=1 Tax=Enterobacteriaceae endosymbiont of Plateumaris braccata TaxID=2675793 RepID=UPI001449BA99|nr:M3 family metallopeptidase [Enterobacteriaceae endosymbiont of Plateumaris braccata]QJC28132.1 oligopeptidase A [Enterobacteriaceae endosymbiont of Plateumaris braccata]